MKKIALIIGLLLLMTLSFAQKGGKSTYSFLGIGNPARVTALGGDFLAVNDGDFGVAMTNPSLISPDLNNFLSLTYINYFSGINYGNAAYSRSYDKLGSFIGAVQFAHYGKFVERDETGEALGNTSASDYSIQLGWGKMIDSCFRVGATFKNILSFYDVYSSWGMAVDVSGSYLHPNGRFQASLWLNNMGTQIISYNKEGLERLPFEIAAGLSQRFKHAPFRFNLQLRNLEKWNLTYDDPVWIADNTDPYTGEVKSVNKVENFADNFMRHIVLGMEFLPFDAFSFQFAYNYGKRQEMKTESRTAMVGFSWGFGLKFTKFQINYARSTYHLAGSPNYFTITLNLNEL